MNKKVYKKVNKYEDAGWLEKNAGGIASALGTAGSFASDLVSDLRGNQEAYNAAKSGINQISGTTFNAGNTSDLMSQWSSVNYASPVDPKSLRSDSGALELVSGAAGGAAAGISFGLPEFLIGTATGVTKGLTSWLGGKANAKKRAEELNRQGELANSKLYANFNEAASNLQEQQLYNAMANYAADGGPLKTNGIEWPSDLMFINNGGTHEENPNEGVQIGVDNEGVPNLVEEGEVIYNDYVFSNRLKVPKKDKREFRLGKKDITFADAVEELAKESKERPNDAISERGLRANLDKLISSQEGVRAKKSTSSSNKFNNGGPGNFNVIQPIGQNIKLPTTQEIINEYASRNVKPVKIERPAYATTDDESKFNWTSTLRYAPVLGSAIGLLTNKADYSNADLISNQINSLPTVGFNPLGDYLTYNPMDVNYLANKTQAQAAATRRNIMNNYAGNRGAATAALMAADYNTQTALGDAYMKGLEYNQGLKERVSTFNRGTNQVNAEMGLKTSMANSDIARTALDARIREATMREVIANNTAAARSANLTTLFDNLGAFGKEEYMKDWINNRPDLYYTTDGEYKKASCGGKINRRRRRK